MPPSAIVEAIENLQVAVEAGGVGGGDASAANQDEQTALLTTIDTSATSIDTHANNIETATEAIQARLPAALGQTTKAQSLAVTIASDQFAGPQVFSGVLTIANTSHVAGDCVGGQINLANVVAANGGSCIIESVMLIDEGEQGAAMELWVFSDAPAADGDDAAFDPTFAELAAGLACPPISISGWSDATGQDIAGRYVGFVCVTESDDVDLYLQLVTRETKTFEANSIHYRIVTSPV